MSTSLSSGFTNCDCVHNYQSRFDFKIKFTFFCGVYKIVKVAGGENFLQ